MINPQESAQEIKSYLYKLSSVIERKSALPFSKVKHIEKVLLDDILCCIEASFSSEYKRFVKDCVDDGDIIINEYPTKQGGKATVLEDSGDGSEYLVALENSHTRGSHESPALSWAETEFGYKPEKAYFDREGKRTISPSARRKQKEKKAELDFIYKNAIAEINMAETKEDLMDAIDEVGRLDDERMNDIFIRVSDKIKELGIK